MEKSDCPVCYNEIIDTIPLNCNHWVCRICIVKSKQDKCPICRAKISISDHERWYIQYLIRSSNNTRST